MAGRLFVIGALLWAAACTPPPRPVDLRALAALRPGELPGMFHVVRRGETLGAIARAYGVPAEWIAEMNGLDLDRRVRAGREVFVPGAQRPAWVERETAPREPVGRVLEAVREGKPVTFRGPLAWPLRGVVHSAFGAHRARAHGGLDIGAPEGTEVRAAATGTVVFSDGLGSYGNVILIRHQPEVVTVYAHNRENLVATGQRVEAGQVIAKVGRTGNATGPHLHFEVRIAGRPRNPLELLP